MKNIVIFGKPFFMKKIFTLSLFLYLSICGYSQTTIYLQTFNSTYSDWSLNTTDLGGIGTSASDNQWIVNNVYLGGTGLITVPNTADEPSGITGYPESYYLHIYNPEDVIYGVPNNCNFLAGGSSTYFVAQNSPVSTTGYTGVTFSFWWLCQGDASAYGKVYYRTSATGPWTVIPGTPATFYGSSLWAQHSVTNPVFDGQAFLEFGFQFTEDLTGNDPAFAVDDIKVTGIGGSAPTPAFTFAPTTATCIDTSILFTNTSTGSVDSFRWTIPGGTPATSTVSPVSASFSAAGTHTVTLTDYHGGTPYTTTHVVTVNPAPHPVIHYVSPHTLSVSNVYSGYQWLNGSSIISGATSSTFVTTTGSMSYYVVVDSAGCPGISAAFTYSTTEAGSFNQPENNFWLYKSPATGNMTLNAGRPLDADINVLVYDATGRVLLSEMWPLGATSKDFDADSLPRGFYFIRFANQATQHVMKWVK